MVCYTGRYDRRIEQRLRTKQSKVSDWPVAEPTIRITGEPSFCRNANIGVPSYCTAAFPPYATCKCMNKQFSAAGNPNILPWKSIDFHDLHHTFIQFAFSKKTSMLCGIVVAVPNLRE